jgi:hypothetical protein
MIHGIQILKQALLPELRACVGFLVLRVARVVKGRGI